MGDSYSTASAQYNDAEGTIAVDWHEIQSNIHYWYRRLNGPGTHWPIAMSIYSGESGYVSVTVLAVERNADMKDFEGVQRYLADAERGEEIPVKEVRGQIPLDEIFSKMKRCHILLFQQGFHDLNLTLRGTGN